MDQMEEVSTTATLTGFKAKTRTELRSLSHERRVEMLIDLKNTEKFEVLNWRSDEQLGDLTEQDAFRMLHDLWDLAQKL